MSLIDSLQYIAHSRLCPYILRGWLTPQSSLTEFELIFCINLSPCRALHTILSISFGLGSSTLQSTIVRRHRQVYYQLPPSIFNCQLYYGGERVQILHLLSVLPNPSNILHNHRRKCREYNHHLPRPTALDICLPTTLGCFLYCAALQLSVSK